MVKSDTQSPSAPAVHPSSPNGLAAALKRMAILHDEIARESRVVAEKYRDQIHVLENSL